MDYPQERYQEAINLAIEALKAPTESTNTPTDLISRQSALDAIRHDPNDTYDAIKSLPLRLTEYKTFCGIPIEEASRIVQEHKADPLCALADRTCPFQGKEFAWCLTCPHISEEDRELVKKAVEGSEPKTGEWIEPPTPYYIDGTHYYRCSLCYGDVATDEKYDYCPNCGAKMFGEDGEEE